MGSEMLSSCGDIKVKQSSKRLRRDRVRLTMFQAWRGKDDEIGTMSDTCGGTCKNFTVEKTHREGFSKPGSPV